MIFDRSEFTRFCRKLEIDSKEFGTINLKLLGSQKYFLDEVIGGIQRGIHEFFCLKSRQLGISTVCWSLDLYWLFKHRGLRGTLITHDDDTREESRANLTAYIESLPVEFKIPPKQHNRLMLELHNRSRLSYQVAGVKKTHSSGKLGRGKGINFLHATEISSYADEDAIFSLQDSLAEQFEERLYIWESTARGFNMWYDLYSQAEKNSSQHAFFIGWWRNELYQVKKDSEIFRVYGRDDPTQAEWEWIDGVAKMYDHQITIEQLAWSRWKLKEGHKGSESSFFQEFPPLPDYAWQMSGSKFFRAKTLTENRLVLDKAPPPAQTYLYQIGPSFDRTELIPCVDFQAELTVWEEPDPLGVYAIAADPAYGADTTSDRYCIQVLKCFADGADQVAEYCTTQCTCYAFAWIIAHLAGAYRDSTVMLEINGPGMAVWQEFQRLQQTGGYNTNAQVHAGLLEVISNVRNYLYHRPDSIAGNFAYHWKQTNELKESIFNKFRDAHERGLLIVRSRELIDEMRTVTNQDGIIGAGSQRQKDDRAVTAAMAVECWQALMQELFERHWTRAEHFAKLAALENKQSIFQAHLSDWLQRFQPQIQ